jgi:aspartyl-tRNA synthetase
LRNPLIIADLSKHFQEPSVAFNAFKRLIAAGGAVRAVPAPGAAAQPRSFFDKLNDWARQEMGAPGLGYIVFEQEAGAVLGKGPIAKFIPAEVQARMVADAGLQAGTRCFSPPPTGPMPRRGLRARHAPGSAKSLA